MNRATQLQRLEDEKKWDVAIIGGGATGLACAMDAATRGLRTILFEQGDFAEATSGRSTKLIHGGVRYLRQGNIRLVRESLRERELLLKNAPHLVNEIRFVLPCYNWLQMPWYALGMKIYDAIRGNSHFADSETSGYEEVLRLLPGIKGDDLKGAVSYSDAQFDDARLALEMALTAQAHGALCLNYLRIEDVRKVSDGFQVTAHDLIAGKEYSCGAQMVVNAGGIYGDRWRQGDKGYSLVLSRGSHIVLDQEFLSTENALIIPKTDDGRVIFAIPWLGKLVVGTTDVACNAPEMDPRVTDEEIDYLLEHLQPYLAKTAQRSDIRSCFAGIRPLIAQRENKATQALSRDHKIWRDDNNGLVQVAGGKWTTARLMAEETIDFVLKAAGKPPRASVTRHLALADDTGQNASDPKLRPYGNKTDDVKTLINSHARWQDSLHPRLEVLKGQVLWAVRHEQALTVADVLSRRTRSLMLDARAALESAEAVAAIMAEELNWSAEEQQAQIGRFKQSAQHYVA